MHRPFVYGESVRRPRLSPTTLAPAGAPITIPLPTLLVTTAESDGYAFPSTQYGTWFAHIERSTLPVGDYAIAGYTDQAILIRRPPARPPQLPPAPVALPLPHFIADPRAQPASALTNPVARALCAGILRHPLPTGDYSVAGYEDRIAIARMNLTHLYASCAFLGPRRRLLAAGKRLARISHRLLLIEASFPQVLAGAPNCSTHPNTVFDSLEALAVRWGIYPWFVSEDRAITDTVIAGFLYASYQACWYADHGISAPASETPWARLAHVPHRLLLVETPFPARATHHHQPVGSFTASLETYCALATQYGIHPWFVGPDRRIAQEVIAGWLYKCYALAYLTTHGYPGCFQHDDI